MLGFTEYAKNKAKKKVVLIVGSPRSPDCCPDEKSKTHKISEEIRKNRLMDEAIEVFSNLLSRLG